MTVRAKVSDYIKYFRDDKEDEVLALQHLSREVLDWMSQPYHEKFVKWLDREASKPFNIDLDEKKIVSQAVRANTLREISNHLARLATEAQAALKGIGE